MTILVKIWYMYIAKDGTVTELCFSKRFERDFVPQVGWQMYLDIDGKELCVEVETVTWRCNSGIDEIVVDASERIRDDDDKIKQEHRRLYGIDGWWTSAKLKIKGNLRWTVNDVE